MVLTRRKAQELSETTGTPVKDILSNPRLSAEEIAALEKPGTAGKSWAESDGTGDRNSFLGLSGTLGKLVSVVGASILMVICPAFAIAT